MKKKVEDVLIELGIYPNLPGFHYICKAVYYIMKDGTVKASSMYEMVAKEFSTTNATVKQSIRRTLLKVDKESEAYKQYINIKDGTSSVILYTIAVKLKED